MRQPQLIRRPTGSIGFDRIPIDPDDRTLEHPREFWRGVAFGMVLAVAGAVVGGVVVWGLVVWSVP